MFIIERQIVSEFKIYDLTHRKKDSYKYDFVAFYRKDLDWLAFVTILFNVNIVLIIIDKYIIFTDEKAMFAL